MQWLLPGNFLQSNVGGRFSELLQYTEQNCHKYRIIADNRFCLIKLKLTNKTMTGNRHIPKTLGIERRKMSIPSMSYRHGKSTQSPVDKIIERLHLQKPLACEINEGRQIAKYAVLYRVLNEPALVF